MQGLHAGVRVTARGDVWTVIASRSFAAGAFVELEGCGIDNGGRRTTLITPFDIIEPAPVERLVRRPRGATIRTVLSLAARARSPHHLWTLVDGGFDLHQWQLAPALSAIGGTTRMLLADGVGLGKTLQAALVAVELAARGLSEHALVLTPPGLREQWVDEFQRRVGLQAVALDARVLALHRSSAAGPNPWTSAPVVVASIDFAKQPDVRAGLDIAPFDLLIVDEAHHLTPGSDRLALVTRLARRIPWLVLASATPHDGDALTFDAILALGACPGPAEPPMRVFRLGHRTRGGAVHRRVTTLRVRPTEAERQLVTGLHAYSRALCKGPLGARPGVRLVAAVLARRATSSAWAAERSLIRRLTLLDDSLHPDQAGTEQPALPWEADQSTEDSAHDRWLRIPGLTDRREERQRLIELVAMARLARVEGEASKMRCLRRLLAHGREPAIVFTEFRDTLEACRRALGASAALAILHGGLSATERRQALDDFLRGRASVLLTTDVASEGLNLHTRARLIITMEWPWSPRRLEQRIGRVDRMGQNRTVHAVHLTAHGTFEDTVVARLLLRSARAREELERATASQPEGAVDAAVLDGAQTPNEPAGRAARMEHDGLASLECARASECRRLARTGGPPARRPAWAPPPRRGRPSSIVVVMEVTRARAGRLQWSQIVPVEARLEKPPRTESDWRRCCLDLARETAIHRAAETAARSQEGAEAAAAPSLLVARLECIRRDLASRKGPPLQASLFDRRAIRNAEARASMLATLEAHLRRSLEHLEPHTATDDVQTRVVAVVPLDVARA